MTDAPSPTADAVALIADAIESRLDGLVAEIVDTVAAEIPAYHLAHRESFRALASAEVAAGLDRIRSGSTFVLAGAREAYRGHGERFAEQGIPLSDVTRAFEVSIRVLIPEIIREAHELGPHGVNALGHYLRLAMDQLTGAVSLVSSAYLDRANAIATERRRARDELLVDLLTGPLSEGTLATAAGLGFPRAERYCVIVAPLPADEDEVAVGDVRRAVAALDLDEWSVVLGHILAVPVPLMDDDASAGRETAQALGLALADVLPSRPLVALGSPGAELDGIRASFHEATDVVEAAHAAGIDGVVTTDDVRIHRILLAAPDVARELKEMIAPLVAYDSAHAGSLLETTEAYLDAGLSAVDAAAALGVHRNTLRYRLDAAERLLGAPLPSLRVALRLALIARRLDIRAGSA